MPVNTALKIINPDATTMATARQNRSSAALPTVSTTPARGESLERSRHAGWAPTRLTSLLGLALVATGVMVAGASPAQAQGHGRAPQMRAFQHNNYRVESGRGGERFEHFAPARTGHYIMRGRERVWMWDEPIIINPGFNAVGCDGYLHHYDRPGLVDDNSGYYFLTWNRWQGCHTNPVFIP